MLSVVKLKKKFDSRGIAGLSEVSFSLDQGKIMAIMGPNGCGKTTLLNMIAGKIQSDSGEVSHEGNICFFPTSDAPSEMNVQKFLISKVTLDIHEDKKLQLARDLADTFEFTFQLRQKISELSSGQKQKILLASELINSPRLFLMDEPFAHLDPFTRKDILSALFRYIRQQGITVLWVTHELNEAFKFSDKMAVMNFGRFEQEATPLELLKSPRNLFVAQFMGYRNFFPIKENETFWETPWGNWALTTQLKTEALMVIPDEAWEISADSESKVTIEEIYPVEQALEYKLRQDERVFTLRRKTHLPLLDAQVSYRLKPHWEECFVIPL